MGRVFTLQTKGVEIEPRLFVFTSQTKGVEIEPQLFHLLFSSLKPYLLLKEQPASTVTFLKSVTIGS